METGNFPSVSNSFLGLSLVLLSSQLQVILHAAISSIRPLHPFLGSPFDTAPISAYSQPFMRVHRVRHEPADALPRR